ncbi:hypothetical protein [Tellurirhabdus rosea]|uniref:hypothetical protein n=1 Tax=Tellurirhabdus rosea TaxID=2674997 RepID=UPI0022585F68|nr:hypothetical protein [Tellurirhabdus rosea]
MKTGKLLSIVTGVLLALSLASCGPTYVGVRPDYGPGYRYYGARPYAYRPPVIVTPPPRYYAPRAYRYYKPSPRYYGNRGYRTPYRGYRRR